MKKYLLLFLCITLWLGVLVGLRGFAATEASVPAGSVRVRTENGILELELEDEKVNPKYGILTVKGYLQKAKFAPDTTIELAGTPVGIYE